MNKYQQFRSENPVFLYKSYSIKENHDKIDLEYCFEIPDLAEFHPKWSFPNPKKIKIENVKDTRRKNIKTKKKSRRTI